MAHYQLITSKEQQYDVDARQWIGNFSVAEWNIIYAKVTNMNIKLRSIDQTKKKKEWS